MMMMMKYSRRSLPDSHNHIEQAREQGHLAVEDSTTGKKKASKDEE
jgi:hypothetical protein